ncbi:hypothetical protein [Stenotrophomonas oahuensis]|uniref:Phosphoesterase n=1 Tax=Stenotrophomonas oahuensis TaxID=3003271 RepID=A0ABY9YKS9_9GAMM|nr:hypothetical protein [Stenotrophomonas sp. A5586]WNH51270.1 hypothetical protein PDM29_12945 [Stenotrophomonas sp. A5586]
MKTLLAMAMLATSAPALATTPDSDAGRQWLAGDHHVHSEWSVEWDRSTTPPTPIRGGDSSYSRSRNAAQAKAFGLRWMVHTDHGGPGHSVVTRDHAYPALLQARVDVPDVIQFNGMEFDVPAGEHASLIIAPGPDERDQLVTAERDYSRSEPLQGSRDTQQEMLAALGYLDGLQPQPLMLINHPSRTATGVGVWGKVTPEELRSWHAAAPQVLVGMEGAPGHQGIRSERGLYRNKAAPTFGGFDQMTAQVGGIWDQMLADGLRFWITASSDSHVNVRDGGRDYDPGEYSKTYAWARPEADDILDSLRHGRTFAVTGDLVDRVELSVGEGTRSATLGETLPVSADGTLQVKLRVRQPNVPNANGDRPALKLIELVVGGKGADGALKMQSRHFAASDWQRDGDWISVTWTLPVPANGGFVRARGNSTGERVALADLPGEDPWQDLWFHSNPVFVEVATR